MHLPPELAGVERRDNSTAGPTPAPVTPISSTSSTALPPAESSSTSGGNAIYVVIGIVTIVAIVLFVMYVQLRKRRLRSDQPPSCIPTAYLRNKWRAWMPENYTPISKSTRPSTTATPNRSSSATISSIMPTSSTQSQVERSQSVRSVISLPPYNMNLHPSERLIAREGERAGIDTVVELPETDEAAEERREAEMAALYSIREARRREAVEREARRLERQAARERGDWARIAVLEEESRQRARIRAASEATLLSATSQEAGDRGHSGSRSSSRAALDLSGLAADDSAVLIAQLASQREANTLHARVSSVSYADLGLARHDGSRIRADSADSRIRSGSMESDNHPLLSSAASMGGSRAHSRASSPGVSLHAHGHGLPRQSPVHRRHASNVSMESLDSDAGSGSGILTPHTSAPGTRSGSAENGFPLHLTPRSSTSPPPDPPSYDEDVSVHGGEAPPYESPVRERAPELPRPQDANNHDGILRNTTSPRPNGPTHPVPAEQHSRASRPLQQGRPSTPELRDPPRLRTIALRHLPAIEVMSATPVNSAPSTPL